MKAKSNYYLIALVLFCPTSDAASEMTQGSYWQCSAQDLEHKEWNARAVYKKIALNKALEACKKQSTSPLSCTSSLEQCLGFNLILSPKPVWQCTALDQTATPWESSFFPNQDEAGMAAKSICKSQSSVPDSCYINLISCVRFMNGERLL